MLKAEFATLRTIEALKLPGVPKSSALLKTAKKENWTRPEWKGRMWRPHKGQGGGVEYSYKLLPKIAQIAWVQRFLRCEEARKTPSSEHAQRWETYLRASENQKSSALNALKLLVSVEELHKAGWTIEEAIEAFKKENSHSVSRASVMRWRKMVRNIEREHWLCYLVPEKRGPKSSRASCSEEAWDFVKTDWLRAEKPSISACYRRLCKVAEAQGWTIPSEKTISRWLSELPIEVKTLAREGREAVRQLIPAQERDRRHLHALDSVNADGHKWDVMVEWPDGTKGRPLMVAWQDLYSNMIVSWRVDRSENTDLIQLALGDMVEKYGIPHKAYLDNGRAFASKRMTGGAKTRFRFKIREGDAAGIMTILGIETVFVTPYSGQSKPIERAFRDLAGDVAKHPAFSGAYTGNSTASKPHNYGERCIKLEEFLEVIGAGIEEYNNRPGRKTGVCGGVKSFRQAFEESLSHIAVRKPTSLQRHLWLRAAENIVTSKRDGSLRLMGNRYWGEFLRNHMGESVIVRFDPQALHEGLHVYNKSGAFLGDAPVIEKTGFDNMAAAAEKKRAEKQLLRAAKLQLEAEKRLTISELVKLLPNRNENEDILIDQKLVSPFRAGSVVTKETTPFAEENAHEEEDNVTANILNFMRQSA
ncbi:transposase domain-containing protein [Aristophania vespae]|uniref:transposase domain-containing protein n=1 Tax=Aristophania vespae TaxID=2697033 RepID=UPI0023515A53|nr:transposase domain-containing protein [Aristophania vespae]UMM63790.1 hypothetical protein DM15PD_07670 [Aristophania vespae]